MLCSTDHRDRRKRIGPRCTLQPWAEGAAHNCLCEECAPRSWTRTPHPGISGPGVGHWHINATNEKPDTAHQTTRYIQVANDIVTDDDLKGPVLLSRLGVLTTVDGVATVNPFTRGILDY